MANISFLFQYETLPHLGTIFQPLIPIKLKTTKGLVEFQFIVDTGADLTTLPHFMASELGIDLSKSRKSSAEGIGGFRLLTWITKIDLVFPTTTVRVRASITDENSTPFLLGRVDCLDVVYSWNFNASEKHIQFIALEPVGASESM